jgi:hypothetical protein
MVLETVREHGEVVVLYREMDIYVLTPMALLFLVRPALRGFTRRIRSTLGREDFQPAREV